MRYADLPSTDLLSCQSSALAHAAGENGDWTRLAYFYWMSEDQESLNRLGEQVGHANPNMTALLNLARPQPHLDPSILNAVNKPWILYYMARHWLRENEPRLALSCGQRCLDLTPGHSAVFPLIISWAHSQGNIELAQSLCKLLLKISPQQDDLRQLLEQPDAFPPTSCQHLLYPPPLDIGYYVPVYNAATSLAAVLNGVLRQAYPLSEFVVVDDGSTDHSAVIAADFPARVISHPRNRGLATARNTALSHMAAPYVGSCDSDAVLDPDYLIYAAIELQSSVGTLAAVGGRMIELHTDTIADSWRNEHMKQDTGAKRLCSASNGSEPTYLPGCNTVVHRETLLAAGGYDESHVAVGEDGTMNRALHRLGHGLATTPLARCHHLRRDSPYSVLRTRWAYELENREENQAFRSLGNLMRQFTQYLNVAATMATEDSKRNGGHRLPMELLYVYVLFLLTLRHARVRGALSLGQEHWFQHVLCNNSLTATEERTVRLRTWRDQVLSPLRLPADCPLELPPRYSMNLFRSHLDSLNQWIHQWGPEMDLARVSATQ